MRTIDQMENDLDASERQPESWAIELGIAVVVSMVVAVLCISLWQ